VALFVAPPHIDEDSQKLDSDGEQGHTSICSLEGRRISQFADDMDNTDAEGDIEVSSANLHGTECN
jgi:hypothetical protein